MRHLACATLVVIPIMTGCSGGPEDSAATPSAKTDDPLAKLEIATAKAEVADSIPVGTVPGQITLPPQARVAVTSPFPGVAVRVYVIEGQAVRKGQALALVRAAEPVQFRGDLARSRAELDNADSRARRLEQLASEGIIAQARVDEARAAAQQARASVTESQRLVSLAGAGSDGTMTLRAPIGGRISHVAIDTGGPVDGMTAPFVIENTRSYLVDLQLPERLSAKVRPGMVVDISVPVAGGDPAKVGGQILSVAPSIDPATRSVMAKASIGNAPGFVAGRNVSVTISAQPGVNTKGVTVPASAVTKIDGTDHVFVRTGKTYKPRKVEVAAQTAERAVISEGLNAGETVATTSIAELKAMNAE
ncbi:MAG: efflux RND transporter periplasmic adaptor subunit [Caenibius sp.]